MDGYTEKLTELFAEGNALADRNFGTVKEGEI